MNLESASATRAGPGDGTNEDAVLEDPVRGVFAVADGLGGSRRGEVASRIAIDVLRSELGGMSMDRPPADGMDVLKEAFVRANADLLAAGDRAGHRMQTTLTAAVVAGGSLFLAHVGDSRAYLMRDGRATRLTEDDRLVAEMVRDGLMSESEAGRHPHRTVLSGCLGQFDRFRLQAREVPLEPGSLVMLCTDGVTEALSDDRIGECLQRASSAREAAERLVDEAATHVGDDMTAVVLKVPEGP
ncbi:MAG: protein phosphatase 2C domain-containing protein [Candidatus Brocadiia bacterium]